MVAARSRSTQMGSFIYVGWAKMGQFVLTNGPKWLDKYQPQYPIFMYLFFNGYSLDTYSRSIGYVSVSDTYPMRIQHLPDVSVQDKQCHLYDRNIKYLCKAN
jgi:hypothetical protein